MTGGTERLDCLPDGITKIWQDSREFCFTTDAVFLAAFPIWYGRPAYRNWAAGPGQ